MAGIVYHGQLLKKSAFRLNISKVYRVVYAMVAVKSTLRKQTSPKTCNGYASKLFVDFVVDIMHFEIKHRIINSRFVVKI